MRVTFGDFTFDSATRTLLDGDRPVHLSPKAFDILELLLTRRPDVVRKDDILSAIWPGIFVGDAALSVAIADIRRALRDEAKDPQHIRTVHRVGYAFCANARDEVTPARSPAAGRCWLILGGRTFALAEGENAVGRDPQCSVRLDEPGVSRRHARIAVRGATVTIEDLESKNGTYVRGRPIAARTPLQDGDEVRFGSTEMTIRIESSDRLPETVRLPTRDGKSRRS